MPEVHPAINTHCVGNAALFAVAYRLSLLGWSVLITSRNSKGPDLYFMDAKGRTQSVQVKGIQRSAPANVSGFSAKGAEGSGCKWWIIVRNLGLQNEEFFIMKPSEVIAVRNRHGWALPPDKFRGKWQRIGCASAPLPDA